MKYNIEKNIAYVKEHVPCDRLEQYNKQIRAEALNIDMEKPMHFTDEQKAWVKNYIIINAKRQRAEAIEEFAEKIRAYSGEHYIDCDGYSCKPDLVFMTDAFLDDIVEQLKENK